jgi:hypothetical protein
VVSGLSEVVPGWGRAACEPTPSCASEFSEDLPSIRFASSQVDSAYRGILLVWEEPEEFQGASILALGRLTANYWLIFVLAALHAYAQSAAQQRRDSLPILTTARAVHTLSSSESTRRYPVHLHGVITYYDQDIDSRRGSMFMHDDSGDIYVAVYPAPSIPVHQGMLVDLIGVSSPGISHQLLRRPNSKALENRNSRPRHL